MKRIATSQLWRCLLHDPLRWLPHRLLNTAATGPFTAMSTSLPSKSTSSRTVCACRKLRRASWQRRCVGDRTDRERHGRANRKSSQETTDNRCCEAPRGPARGDRVPHSARQERVRREWPVLRRPCTCRTGQRYAGTWSWTSTASVPLQERLHCAWRRSLTAFVMGREVSRTCRAAARAMETLERLRTLTFPLSRHWCVVGAPLAHQPPKPVSLPAEPVRAAAAGGCMISRCVGNFSDLMGPAVACGVVGVGGWSSFCEPQSGVAHGELRDTLKSVAGDRPVIPGLSTL